jgi:signal transduction histidine kinase
MLKAGSRSVRGRLVRVMLATTLTALIVAGGALIYQDLRVFERSVVEDVATYAEILGRASSQPLRIGDPHTGARNLSLLRAKPTIRAAALYDTRGALFTTYVRDGLLDTSEIPGKASPDQARISADAVVVWKRILGEQEPLGTIYLKADYDAGEHMQGYLGIMLLVLLAGLAVALAMAAWLQSSVTRPILAIRDVARAVVEKRDFSLRAKRVHNDEIGYLADAFNGVLEEIEHRTSALEQSNVTLAEQIRERESAEAALRKAEEDLRELNAQLEQRVSDRTEQLAAANKDLESFSYSVSHDLRAPVRAIAGFSKLLAEHHEDALDDEAKRKLGIVRSEAARMGTLIDDLLAFSRLGRQALQKRTVDMEELARLNFEALNAEHTERVPSLRLGSLPQALGDRSLLAQVWINLLSNAIKFSSKREQPRIEVNAISDDREHTYFVRDNGAGFDAKYASKLFGVFQRLHDPADFPGTGVGLALVHRIITRHGGRVWAEGRLDEGATFYFTLPRSPKDGRV